MADLLREVDDAVRADNMKRLWEEHKTAIVTAIAALILGTAAWSAWTSWKLEQNHKQTGEIVAALESRDAPSALTSLAQTQSGNGPAIALLNAAALQLKSGDKQKAFETYVKAQNAKKSDAVLRDLATLQKVNLSLDIRPDTAPKDLLKELEMISSNKSSPWQGEALFMSAFITGEKLKDYSAAAKDLKTLSARTDITQSIRQRAEALQSVYELKQQEKK